MAEIWSESKKWKLVQATVQGQPSSASCSFLDGRIVCSLKPIPKGAEQNLKLLSEILRSDEPLPSIAREWLADLFDPSSKHPYRVKALTRRVRGATPIEGLQNREIEAARRALGLMERDESDIEKSKRGRTHEKWEHAVQTAAGEFNMSETAVEDAIKEYRAAVASTENT